MKKIMFVETTIGGGGTERIVVHLANHFVSNAKIEIFCLESYPINDYNIENEVIVKSLDDNPPRGNKIRAIISYLLRVRKTRKMLKNEIIAWKPDVVFSLLPKSDILVYSLRKSCDFTWIASERNDPWERSCFERFVLNKIYKYTDFFVCQTDVVDRFYKSIGLNQTRVISNPVFENKKDDWLVGSECLGEYAIAVGHIDAQKNYKLMISSFIEAKKEVRSDLKLIILGEGPLRSELTLFIDRLGYKDSILMKGRKSNVGYYLSNAKFYIMSSNYEGMPNALLEALETGLPVICTDYRTGSSRELVKQNGLLVPVGNQKAMTEAIVKFMQMDSKRLQTMGDESKKVFDEYKKNSVMENWESLLL